MATLPSISSLLQFAGSNSPTLGSPAKSMDIAALKSHEDSEQSEDNDIPRPLTGEVVRQALSELPNGSAQALQSCLSAYKVRGIPS
eukprot:3324376-Rhodomonas_salina.2